MINLSTSIQKKTTKLDAGVKNINGSSAFTIPVISYQGLLQQNAAVEQALCDALRDVGFFALIDHDLAIADISKAYDQVIRLFNVPLASKLACARPELGGQVGFTRFFQEIAKGAAHPDLKEYWHVMRPAFSQKGTGEESGQLAADDQQSIPANIWPESQQTIDGGFFDTQACQEVLLSMFATLDGISKVVLGAISLYLQEPRSFLPSLVEDGYSVLRLLHYPALTTETYPGSVRAAAHEDINFITLLVSATAPGLQLLQRDGSWLPVIAPEGAIIIDSADMLSNLTNGLLKATTHQVVNTSMSQEPRYSMPFFVHPRPGVSLKPRPASVRMHPGQFGRDITAADFLRERLIEIGVLSPVTDLKQDLC